MEQLIKQNDYFLSKSLENGENLGDLSKRMALPAQETTTLRWNSVRTELLWIYDGVVTDVARHVVSDHRHGYWLWLIRTGSVRLEMDGKVWKASAGQWLISPHGSVVQDFSEDAKILSVHFRCHWPSGEDLFTAQEGLVCESKDYPNMERSASKLEKLVKRRFPGVRLELLEQTSDYPSFLELQQCFFQLLKDFHEIMVAQDYTLSHGGDGDDRLWRAVGLLHTAPLDGPFPATLLQGETLLGRTQLDRLFWKAFGTTTHEYWEQLRQDSAISSIEASTMSIKEVSYCLGFKQPSHFTKWFCRRMGVTPQGYREHVSSAKCFKAELLSASTSAKKKKSKNSSGSDKLKA